MQDWINGACDEVDQLTAHDPYYQKLEQARRELEPRYLSLLDALPEAEREIITEYLYLVSEAAYQKTQAAYELGRQRRPQYEHPSFQD